MTFLANAVEYYNEEAHQKAAWDALENRLDRFVQDQIDAATSPDQIKTALGL